MQIIYMFEYRYEYICIDIRYLLNRLKYHYPNNCNTLSLKNMSRFRCLKTSVSYTFNDFWMYMCMWVFLSYFKQNANVVHLKPEFLNKSSSIHCAEGVVVFLFPDCNVHGAHLGPVGPRWAPCWPHEPCYQSGLYQFTNNLLPPAPSLCVFVVIHEMAPVGT